MILDPPVSSLPVTRTALGCSQSVIFGLKLGLDEQLARMQSQDTVYSNLETYIDILAFPRDSLQALVTLDAHYGFLFIALYELETQLRSNT